MGEEGESGRHPSPRPSRRVRGGRPSPDQPLGLVPVMPQSSVRVFGIPTLQLTVPPPQTGDLGQDAGRGLSRLRPAQGSWRLTLSSTWLLVCAVVRFMSTRLRPSWQ